MRPSDAAAVPFRGLEMDTPYTVEGVSVGMAAMDLVPVVLYGTGCHMVGKRLRNPLFTAAPSSAPPRAPARPPGR